MLSAVLGSYDLLQTVIAFYTNKELAAAQESNSLALPTEIAHLSMYILVFNKRPNLTVNHTIELSNKYDLITKMAVLTEELDPSHTIILPPITAIKQQLRFVNHEQYVIFPYRLISPIIPCIIVKVIRR